MAEPYRPPEDVLSFLHRYQKYLLFGHVEPDGDCVASQLALGSFLKRRGKKVSVFSEGPFDRPEIKPFEDKFRNRVEAADLEGTPASEGWAGLFRDFPSLSSIITPPGRLSGMPAGWCPKPLLSPT